MYAKTGKTALQKVTFVAGVSTQTASRAINDRPDVPSKTLTRFQEVIEKLDYKSSALARNVIHERSYTLGVVIAGLKFMVHPGY
jgi:DNA-binding LacI/PurR family transcriptional regulator